MQASPVKRRALAGGLPVYQPRTLRETEPQQRIAAVGADAMVVAAYGLILPAPVLAAPRLGCINIHASLLPRWRGAAPIQRAIEAGDRETGITIMQMDEGLDTGPMLSMVSTPILPGDSGGSLHDRLAALGAAAIVDALAGLEAGRLQAVPQPAEGATYARKLGKADGALDFGLVAGALVDRIRAFDPVPGSVAMLARDEPVPVKFWRARVAAPDAAAAAPHPAAPGTVLAADANGLVVACGRGAIAATELQKPGGKRLGCADFLRGFPISPGERFVPPATT